jgi:hypothetical protein
MIIRTGIMLLLAGVFAPVLLHAQSRFFGGGIVGISTLSADGQTAVATTSVAFSTYRPFNGAALNLFAGAHVNDFLSIQGNYIWNRNDVRVTLSMASQGSLAVFEEKRHSTQNSVIGDVLLYFRDRESWVRPYLSAGTGVVRFKSDHRELVSLQGAPGRLPVEVISSKLALRVAVGIDVAVGRGFAIRYSFSETIRDNPVSSRLNPPGGRNLANFQNLVGIVKNF